MTTHLLDTNICIYIIKNQPAHVRERFALHTRDSLAISAITYGELHFGALKSLTTEKTLKKLAHLMQILPVLPLTADVALHYGDICNTLQTRGQIIGNNDLWIAAHARAEELTLVTNNESEFRRVPNLRLENWI